MLDAKDLLKGGGAVAGVAAALARPRAGDGVADLRAIRGVYNDACLLLLDYPGGFSRGNDPQDGFPSGQILEELVGVVKPQLGDIGLKQKQRISLAHFG